MHTVHFLRVYSVEMRVCLKTEQGRENGEVLPPPPAPYFVLCHLTLYKSYVFVGFIVLLCFALVSSGLRYSSCCFQEVSRCRCMYGQSHDTIYSTNLALRGTCSFRHRETFFFCIFLSVSVFLQKILCFCVFLLFIYIVVPRFLFCLCRTLSCC